MSEHEAKNSTPAAELERQIMSWSEPKNEREWWALHEIERLRTALEAAEARSKADACKRCGGSGELSGYSQPGADNGPCPDCNGTGQAMLSADSVVVPRELLGKLMANADMHPMGHWATMQLIGKDFLDLRDLYNAALAAKGGQNG